MMLRLASNIILQENKVSKWNFWTSDVLCTKCKFFGQKLGNAQFFILCLLLAFVQKDIYFGAELWPDLFLYVQCGGQAYY